jgi:hypothetical protein
MTRFKKMKFARCLILGLVWFVLIGSSGQSQTPAFADTIWAGTLTASTKVVAHYQNGVERNTVTGATANGIPMELWFPTATTFSVVSNNSTLRASTAEGRNGVMIYDATLYDVINGENPSPENEQTSYWTGKGTVDQRRKQLLGKSTTETQIEPYLITTSSYSYKKRGQVETLTIRGTAILLNQSLDSLGDGWMLEPGVVTFSGTFTKTGRKVSVEGLKQGIEGF